MIYVIMTFVGLAVIGTLAWISARLRAHTRRHNSEVHNRMMSEAAAMSRFTDPSV